MPPQMDTYLIICDDWRLMEEEPHTVCAQFAHLFDVDVQFLAPVLFAEYSCLTQFVSEEIDLVVSNQERNGDARLQQDQFIDFWRWNDLLATKVYHLSGGWRKFLNVTLFLNRKCDSLLFIDFASHFSDRTITRALEGMRQLKFRRVAFVEYDEELMEKHLPEAKRLLHSASRLLPAT
jgi:hypothetical protein